MREMFYDKVNLSKMNEHSISSLPTWSGYGLDSGSSEPYSYCT
jgi:hypothetical protein